MGETRYVVVVNAYGIQMAMPEEEYLSKSTDKSKVQFNGTWDEVVKYFDDLANTKQYLIEEVLKEFCNSDEEAEEFLHYWIHSGARNFRASKTKNEWRKIWSEFLDSKAPKQKERERETYTFHEWLRIFKNKKADWWYIEDMQWEFGEWRQRNCINDSLSCPKETWDRFYNSFVESLKEKSLYVVDVLNPKNGIQKDFSEQPISRKIKQTDSLRYFTNRDHACDYRMQLLQEEPLKEEDFEKYFLDLKRDKLKDLINEYGKELSVEEIATKFRDRYEESYKDFLTQYDKKSVACPDEMFNVMDMWDFADWVQEEFNIKTKTVEKHYFEI